MKLFNPTKHSLSSHLPVVLAVLAAMTRLQAQTLPCIETNGVKFILPPNVDGGLDVKASRHSIVLADDFACTTTGPITDIHLWGSWLGDSHGTITNFWLGIYNDVPAATNAASGKITPSHPGANLLWQQSFTLGQYAESPYATGTEYFYNPTNNQIVGGDTQAWYYCFYPANPFIQQGTATAPTNYWLAVRAQLDPQTTQLFGWKTALVPYNDAAVWGTVDASGLPAGDWQSMTNPLTAKPIDLAFKLTTPTNLPPPTCCPETNGVKYGQNPNLRTGLDVDATSAHGWVLADDFPCTSTGPITDIHLWGSWLNDLVDYSAAFTLTIWSDVPANPTGGSGALYSHPGVPLWSQTFTNYALCPYLSLPEGFREPGFNGGLPNPIGGSTNLYYYCFYPTNPFVQQGTAAQPTNYWLSVSATPGIAGSQLLFGWKSSALAYNDAAVAANGAGLYPPPTAWNPMLDPTTNKLNLAFKLTTATNGCPVPVVCPSDKTVECGSVWSFDPPVVGPDPCCPASPTVYFSAATNAVGPCHESITGTWVIMDCAGTVLKVCSQTVTVTDTTPPLITCASNKTVVAGSAWTFDKPTAVDACCGTNVTISVLNTQTNIHDPCLQFFTRTWLATDCCTNSSTCSQTVTVVCGPPPCVETNGVKNVQGPNLLGGYDVWNTPYVLADDFVCHFSGPITDIHLWGSWLNDQALTNSITFWLGIYDDVPAVSGPVPLPSHPGTNLLWQQWFAPGQYAETIWTANAQEQFLNPGPPQILGGDSEVWYFCFNPTNAFEQLGTATAPKTYWLAAYAQLPAGINQNYGWKTTTNVSHDVSVHAPWPGSPPVNNPGWTPTMIASTGGPLDLAFKLSTPTNVCGPILIRYLSTNKVVLTWASGFLQVSTGSSLISTNVAGTYVDVPGATSPYTNDTTLVPLKFYRLRCY